MPSQAFERMYDANSPEKGNSFYLQSKERDLVCGAMFHSYSFPCRVRFFCFLAVCVCAPAVAVLVAVEVQGRRAFVRVRAH